MALDQDLLKLEKGFWTEDGDYYRDHLEDSCLLAIADMAGPTDKETIAKSNPGKGMWTDVNLDEKGLAKLSDDSVILTYEVNAKKKDGTPYKALVSTGYINRGGEWKMAFHQQTPLTIN